MSWLRIMVVTVKTRLTPPLLVVALAAIAGYSRAWFVVYRRS
jgi:hypothetical protein